MIDREADSRVNSRQNAQAKQNQATVGEMKKQQQINDFVQRTGMNEEQLNCVVAAIQDRRYLLSQELKMQFSKGDKVSFETKGGEFVKAIVIKRNPKSIQCHELDNKFAIWNVSPSLLTLEGK